MPAHSGTYNMAWLPSWVAVRTLYVPLPLRAYKMAMYLYNLALPAGVSSLFSDLSLRRIGRNL